MVVLTSDCTMSEQKKRKTKQVVKTNRKVMYTFLCKYYSIIATVSWVLQWVRYGHATCPAHTRPFPRVSCTDCSLQLGVLGVLLGFTPQGRTSTAGHAGHEARTRPANFSRSEAHCSPDSCSEPLARFSVKQHGCSEFEKFRTPGPLDACEKAPPFKLQHPSSYAHTHCRVPVYVYTYHDNHEHMYNVCRLAVVESTRLRSHRVAHSRCACAPVSRSFSLLHLLPVLSSDRAQNAPQRQVHFVYGHE